MALLEMKQQERRYAAGRRAFRAHVLIRMLLQPSVVRGSWESESLLSEDVHNKLLEEVNKLKQIPEEEKDWHPGSDGQVLDLVHPSM